MQKCYAWQTFGVRDGQSLGPAHLVSYAYFANQRSHVCGWGMLTSHRLWVLNVLGLISGSVVSDN